LLLFYAGIGLIIGIPLGFGIQSLLREIALGSGQFGKAGVTFFYALIAIPILCVVIASGFRIRHVQYALRYPPLLFTVALGWLYALTFAFILDLLEPESRYDIVRAFLSTTAMPLALFAALTAMVGARGRIQKAKPLDSTSRDRQSLTDFLNLPVEELLEWLANEAPITTRRNDWLSFGSRADRIWEALQTPRSDADGRRLRKTVVVQGPFGGGKSSLMQLVREKGEGKAGVFYIFVEVNCWGFSSQRAQEHILECTIEALSQHVDCAALRKLPAAYAEALSSTNHWLGIVTEIFGGDSTPLGQLQRLSPILRAVGAQLVVVIEDTDRNGADFDQKHIEAMLHNFRVVEGLSFILTAGEKSVIEFPKIAEHIEFLAPLRDEFVLTIMDRIRDYCRANWDDIDPVITDGRPQNRPKSLLHDARAEDIAAAMFGRQADSWPRAVARLLDTPRLLKAFLNALLSRWKQIHGEVDIDELIMVLALRLAAPRVFSFLAVHIDEIRSLNQESSSSRLSDDGRARRVITDLKEQWREAAESTDADRVTCEAIFQELLPSSGKITGYHNYSTGNRVQSLRSDRGREYWERLGTDSLETSAIRDQAVLTALSKASVDPTGIQNLANSIFSSDTFGEAVLFFDNATLSTSQDCVAKVASAVLSILRQKFGPKEMRQEHAYEVALQWVLRRSHPNQAMDWVTAEIILSVPRNLRLASELYFAVVRDNPAGVDKQIEARRAMVNAARTSIPKMSASDVANCFDPGFGYTLRYLLILDGKQYPPVFQTQPADWNWIGRPLLDALRAAPCTLAPQIIHAFGEYGPSGEAYTWYKFDQNRLLGIFGENGKQILALLLADLDPSPDLDADSRRLIPMAKAEAERLLRDGFDPHGDRNEQL
jgi:hypothetical protein